MLRLGTDRNVVAEAQSLLSVDGHDRPVCRDAGLLFGVVLDLLTTLGPADAEAFLRNGFLRNADARFAEHVAPHMVDIPASSFLMGTAPSHRRHFCGEVPAHPVELAAFQLASCAVTNELFALLFPEKASLSPRERRKPVVGVTWSEAAVFALWLGCRLPTEAEWEFACGAGTDHEWCCEYETYLPNYAWYCQNANGELHEVACLAPNELGLYDMHGNVWEWCADTYDPDFYARSARANPVNLGPPIDELYASDVHKVSRGGSILSLSEMCRNRYRFHEPRGFWASDLGMRLTRSSEDNMEGPLAWLL